MTSYSNSIRVVLTFENREVYFEDKEVQPCFRIDTKDIDQIVKFEHCMMVVHFKNWVPCIISPVWEHENDVRGKFCKFTEKF